MPRAAHVVVRTPIPVAAAGSRARNPKTAANSRLGTATARTTMATEWDCAAGTHPNWRPAGTSVAVARPRNPSGRGFATGRNMILGAGAPSPASPGGRRSSRPLEPTGVVSMAVPSLLVPRRAATPVAQDDAIGHGARTGARTSKPGGFCTRRVRPGRPSHTPPDSRSASGVAAGARAPMDAGSGAPDARCAGRPRAHLWW